MSIVSILLNKIARLFLGLFGGFRRALCCLRRRRRNSGTPLPIALKYDSTEISSDLQSWETWNEEDSPVSIHIDGSHISQSQSNNMAHQASWSEDPEVTQSDLDYFKDMVPEFKRPKKVIVKQEEEPTVQAISSRLALDVKAPLALSPELGVIDDVGGSWEDAAASEDLWDAEEVLREKRRQEKAKKLAEHQRRKQEKEGKKGRYDTTFSATKLS